MSQFNTLISAVFIVLTLMSSVAVADTNQFINKIIDHRGFSGMSLSPDHKYVAVIVYRDSSYGLALYDIANRTQKLIVKPKHEAEGFWIFNKQVHNATWVTKDLIAIDFGAVIESVNLEGKRIARLAESRYGVEILGKAEPDNPDSTLLLVKINSDLGEIAIVDVVTGKEEIFETPKEGKLVDWAFDKHGQLRALTLHKIDKKKETTEVTQWYRENSSTPWVMLEKKGITENNWEPVYVPEKENSIVIISNQGRDTKAVFLYDTNKREIVEMMAGHPTQDIIGIRGFSDSTFSKVTTSGLTVEQVWFDPKWASLQTAVDEVFPNKVNLLSGDPAKFVLIHSSSDLDAGTWILLDVEKSKLTSIGPSRFALTNVQGQKKYTFTYPSKDGLNIPAYLTLPEGKKWSPSEAKNSVTSPSPLVVYIHGGPISRNYWKWDDAVQILAKEGYAVFQPQFRGSHGFGKRFEVAGYRQWGLAMQDDITEGVEYLIAQGIADPKKICIYGASYGGYSAMWGLIKTPNLYQCGVSFAGVVDIEYMFKDSSDSNSNQTAVEQMRYTVGDINSDRAIFDSVSPLKHAEKILAPILLMHGGEDLRVPIEHSKKMMRAMDKYKIPYEWLLLENEGHGIYEAENQKKYYTKLIEFLAKYLR